MASSSSTISSTNGWKYDVFMSFGGDDTRQSFSSHLYLALSAKGISTYFDEFEVVRGENFADSNFQAIYDSRISLVIFSKTKHHLVIAWISCSIFSSVESKQKGQIVVPIFYYVFPSEVEKQTGKYGESFTKHEACFTVDEVKRWRFALAEASFLRGVMIYMGDEAQVIQNIVETVSEMLGRSELNGGDKPVGLDSHVGNMLRELNIGSNDVRMVGFWGVGGIGKTSLAQVVYNRLVDKFDGSCFLANVRDSQLQKTLFNVILGTKMSSGVINIIKDKLCNKKVLIVIDDVDQVEQLKMLVGALDWFGMGSRVIISWSGMERNS